MKLLLAEECEEEPADEVAKPTAEGSLSTPGSEVELGNLLTPQRKKPVLISGSLDNTIKLWDIETGQATRTYFGHIEGVWAVASDKMRLVSGSHDRTIKVSMFCFIDIPH